MLVYYRDKRILITTVAIWVDGEPHSFDRFDRVWRESGGVSRVLLRWIAVLAGALTAGYALAAALPDLHRHYDNWLTAGAGSSVLILIGALAAGGLLVLLLEAILYGIEGAREHGRYHELWVVRDGDQLLLLRMSDATKFGQVYRALTRAMEAHAR
jgi:hypothetical protein